MKMLLITLSLFCCLSAANSKTCSDEHSSLVVEDTGTLVIGDRVPDILLPRVLNTPNQSVSLSEYHGKLIILDFWKIGCSPCIASMPKMQELQDKYPDRLQVLLVTPDSEPRVKALFDRLKLLKEVHLASVVEDEALHALFEFRSVPTHVWISEEGKVLQITSGANTIEEKIDDYFAGKEVKLPVRQQHKDFDHKTPLWMEGDGRQLKYLEYYSYIMSYNPDAGGLTGVNRDPLSGKNVRVVAANQSLLQLYKMAYGAENIAMKNPFNQDCRVVLDLGHPERFYYPDQKERRSLWREENVFCYELVVPPDQSDVLFDYMQQDLARYFGIAGHIEQRDMPCLVLKRTSDQNKIATAGGQFKYATNYGESLEISNMPMEWLINTLQTYLDHLEVPIIDKTGVERKIDMVLDAKLNDLDQVKDALQLYDLELVEEIHSIDILVLSEIIPGDGR